MNPGPQGASQATCQSPPTVPAASLMSSAPPGIGRVGGLVHSCVSIDVVLAQTAGAAGLPALTAMGAANPGSMSTSRRRGTVTDLGQRMFLLAT